MTEPGVRVHEMASAHLPYFIPGPDGSDGMFTTMTYFIVIGAFVVGALYLKLHSLPEHMAEGAGRVQYQLVGILALLALFTHENAFWIAALVLAVLEIPDVMTPLNTIAASLGRMSGVIEREAAHAAEEAPPTVAPANVTDARMEGKADV